MPLKFDVDSFEIDVYRVFNQVQEDNLFHEIEQNRQRALEQVDRALWQAEDLDLKQVLWEIQQFLKSPHQTWDPSLDLEYHRQRLLLRSTGAQTQPHEIVLDQVWDVLAQVMEKRAKVALLGRVKRGGCHPSDLVPMGKYDRSGILGHSHQKKFSFCCKMIETIILKFGIHPYGWVVSQEFARSAYYEYAQRKTKDLDSLLIFAGLFSAILAAFLIEIRKGLQEDLQSRTNTLLIALLNQTSSIPLPQFKPSASLIHVNALWFLSLTLSLISALGAVLAQGWLASHDPIATMEKAGWYARKHGGDWIGVNMWHVDTVIDWIPVILHGAFFTFFSGLVILLAQDNATIQKEVLALVVATATLYTATTCLPIFYPDCAFRTPVSTLFIKLINRVQESALAFHRNIFRRRGETGHNISQIS